MSTELRFISLNGVSLVEKHPADLHEPKLTMSTSAGQMTERRKNIDRRNGIRFEDNRRKTNAYSYSNDTWANERNR
jgi:hypothetical protein